MFSFVYPSSAPLLPSSFQSSQDIFRFASFPFRLCPSLDVGFDGLIRLPMSSCQSPPFPSCRLGNARAAAGREMLGWTAPTFPIWVDCPLSSRRTSRLTGATCQGGSSPSSRSGTVPRDKNVDATLNMAAIEFAGVRTQFVQDGRRTPASQGHRVRPVSSQLFGVELACRVPDAATGLSLYFQLRTWLDRSIV
jgi:hypothetical protein